MKPRPPSHKNEVTDRQPVPSYHNKEKFWFKECSQELREMSEMWWFFTCWRFPVFSEKSTSLRLAISMDTLLVYVIRRNKFLSSLGNQGPICCKQEEYMLVKVHMQPPRRSVFLWWFFLLASQDPVHPSWLGEDSCTISLDNSPGIQVKATPHKKTVFKGKIEHLCECKDNAS